MRTTTLRVWLEGTIAAALAMVLSFIPTNIGSSFSVSLGSIALVLFALRRGTKAGLCAGLLWGLLHFPLGQAYFLTPVQVIIEYPIAFLFIGFAGLYSHALQRSLQHGTTMNIIKSVWLGTTVGLLARYFWHFIAGFIFWGKYALWGLTPVLFSLVMNGLSCLLTIIVTGAIVSILALKWPRLLMDDWDN